MTISISSTLLCLGAKCLLNWVLVSFQRKHISQSFLGVFSVSLAVMDTALTLFAVIIELHSSELVLFMVVKLTRFHVCLMVQILGQVYSALQWPVVTLAGLDHFCTLTRIFETTPSKARRRYSLLVSGCLWCITAVSVFMWSDFSPAIDDVPYSQILQCWVFNTSYILQVAMLLLPSLGYAVLHAYHSKVLEEPNMDQSLTLSRTSIVYQVTVTFLKTWILFLFFVVVLLLETMGVPAYLVMNVAWLSFLNSSLIALLLCAFYPTSQLTQDLAVVPSDSFCDWKIEFNLAEENIT